MDTKGAIIIIMNLPKPELNLSSRKKYYLAYSLCFIIIALIAYSWYLISGRTLIWREDGWMQHYKSLIYYSKYLRSIIKGLIFRHELVIPNWDFAIGQGSDILATLHYYTIGDPFSVFSIFFSEDNMYLYYNAAVLLRMFFSGVVFSALCFESGRRNNYAVLAGAMAYVFCEYMFSSMHHPFFLNPMLYFPLLILGIEKIINKKRPYTFIAAVAISAICNIYFFYMMALATIIYVIIRLVILYRENIREGAGVLLKIALSSVLGLILSAVVFLPLIYVLVSDSRTSAQSALHLLYPLEYYSRLPRTFIASGNLYFACMGYAVPILLAVFLMFYSRKKYRLTKSLFITCVIFVMVPLFAQIFNGLAYITNRWIWAFALLCPYILALLWQPLMHLTAKEGIFLFKCTIVYSIVCLLLEYSRSENAFAQLLLAFILLFILFPLPDITSVITYTRKQQLALLIVLISIVLNSYWKTSPNEGNDAASYLEVKQLVLNENETKAVAGAAAYNGDDGFFRYSGRNLTKNANILAKMSSTQYFWSLSNPNISDYRSRIDILENRSFDPSNYDERAGLNSLASVLYYAVPQNDSNPVPYGFTYVDDPQNQSAFKVYRNEYALPLSYTYNNYMEEEAWNALSPVEKEEAMLETVVLSEDTVYTPKASPVLSSYELPFTITCSSDEITLKDNVFTTTAENATATLSFDAVADGEVFICIEGLNFKETPKYDLYYGDESLDPLDLYNEAKWDSLDYSSQYNMKKDKFYWSDIEHEKTSLIMSTSAKESKTLHYSTKDYAFYGGRHDFAGNFSAFEEAVSSIDISFYLRGVYSFDSIKVIFQPMDNYVNQINDLKADSLQNMEIGTDTVTGTINLDSPGILCFSIPYSVGWTAYVDGRETKLYQANIMHMALDLDAGGHDIRLVYETPFLKEGIYASIFGIALFIILIIVNERKIRQNGGIKQN